MAVSRAWGWLRPVRLPLLVRCLGVFSAVPLALMVWPNGGLKLFVGAPLSGEPIQGQLIVVLAAAIYVFYWVRVWPRRSLLPVGLLVAAMALLAGVATDLTMGVGGDLWIYAAIMAGCGLPVRISLPVIGLLAVLLVILPGSSGGVAMGGSTIQVNVSGPLKADGQSLTPGPLPWVNLTARALPLAVIGCAAMVLTFLARTNAELRAAQMQLARLAVDEERARVSRDLHDLLGHNLSLIALKAELATRLLDQPAHPAMKEVDDLRLMARSALGDLREVVGGARVPTLASELDGARIAARAAAIELLVEDERAGVLAPEVEAVCAWVVREGMTNVVKHSGARRCRLRIEQQGGTVAVEVDDDGRGGSGGTRGSGLKGLGERLAALGGGLRVRPRGGVLGGFQLAARLPAGTGDAAA
ncbi:MAG: histidine kinase [Nocardiopsaceae bacterium]|jgi:two-component system sensor histidine kinase DesK|nr:histidine kinase [Nocardiopsaceae bacterium]